MKPDPAARNAGPVDHVARALIVQALRGGEAVTFTARGGSMWPLLRDGATVRVDPSASRALRPGELGCFARGDVPVVHRVVATSARGVTFAGDALGRGDGEVPWAEVLGRASVLAQPALRLRWPRAGEALRALRALGRVARARWGAR